MTKTAFPSRIAEMLSAFVLGAALAAIQVLIGGTRLLFSLPAYGLLAIVGLLSLLSLRRRKPEGSQLCFLTTAVFFAYILARAFLSPVDYLARADIYSALAGLLVYFYVACFFTDARRRSAVICFLLVLALAHVLVGAIQFRDGENFMPISFLQRYDYGRRASGFYVCPNHLAGLLEVLGIFGLSLVCWSRWPKIAKLLIGYVVAVCYVGVVLTGSRGGYLSTGTSLIVFALLSLLTLRRAPPRLFWSISIPGLLIAAVLIFAVVTFVGKSNFLSSRAQSVLETRNMRIDLWKAALQQWKLQPLIGTGSGTYLYYGRQFRTARVQEDPVYVHNDYLHLLAEYGLIGVVLFLPFLGAHAANGWKNFKRLGPKRVAVSGLLSNGMALQIGALASFAAYLVHSFLDFNLHIPANVLLMAFVFGILANAGTRRETEIAAVSWPAIGWRVVPAAIAAVFGIQCARLLPGEYYTERARTDLRDNETADAIDHASRGLEWEKLNPDLYRYLASARMDEADEAKDAAARQKAYQEAISAFAAGRRIAPRDKTFATGLGLAYDELGRFAEGEWMLDEARALDPTSAPTKAVYDAHLKHWQTGRTGDQEDASAQ